VEIKTVTVIGAGVMGNGVAQVSATGGYKVMLNDISNDALTKAMATIEKNLGKMVNKGKSDLTTYNYNHQS